MQAKQIWTRLWAMGRATAFLAVLTAGAAGAQKAWAQADAGLNVDTRFHREVAAGPYSTVSTAHGGLDTVIPLFSVRGPNGTVLDFTIRHRSNQTQIPTNSKWTVLDGEPGAGWYHTYDGLLTVGTSATQTMAGSGAGFWYPSTVNGVTSWVRQPGVRNTLTANTGTGLQIGLNASSNAVTPVGGKGYVVTTLGDRTKYLYAE